MKALRQLKEAGLSYRQVTPFLYRVEGAFSFWPTTERWRSLCGQSAGYGVSSLMQALRDRELDLARCSLSGSVFDQRLEPARVL